MRTKLLLIGAACIFAPLIPMALLSAREPVIAAPIPSYALNVLRPGPLVPEVMVPTILATVPCTLAEGLPPT